MIIKTPVGESCRGFFFGTTQPFDLRRSRSAAPAVPSTILPRLRTRIGRARDDALHVLLDHGCLRQKRALGKERKGCTVKHIGSTEALAEQIGLARERPEYDRHDFFDRDPPRGTARHFL